MLATNGSYCLTTSRIQAYRITLETNQMALTGIVKLPSIDYMTRPNRYGSNIATEAPVDEPTWMLLWELKLNKFGFKLRFFR